MRIDHVIYATWDVSTAVNTFADEYGLAANGGGIHPHLGTRNVLVPTGARQYIELMAVDDPGASVLASGVANLLDTGRHLFALSVEPDNLDKTASRLGLQVIEGERRSTSGRVVRWRMAGLSEAAGPTRLPFFVDWGDSDPDVDRSLNHGVDGIEWVELGGDERVIRAWLGGGDDLPLRFGGGEPGPQAVGIRRGQSTITIQ